jgi:hypothetical protein
MADEELFPLAELARGIGMQPNVLQKAAQRKTLVAQRRGRDWWATHADVTHYMEEHAGRRGRPRKTKQP